MNHNQPIPPAAPSNHSQTQEAETHADGGFFLSHPFNATERFEIEGRLFKALHDFKTAQILDELDGIAAELETAADAIRQRITNQIQYRRNIAAAG